MLRFPLRQTPLIWNKVWTQQLFTETYFLSKHYFVPFVSGSFLSVIGSLHEERLRFTRLKEKGLFSVVHKMQDLSAYVW